MRTAHCTLAPFFPRLGGLIRFDHPKRECSYFSLSFFLLAFCLFQTSFYPKSSSPPSLPPSLPLFRIEAVHNLPFRRQPPLVSADPVLLGNQRLDMNWWLCRRRRDGGGGRLVIDGGGDGEASSPGARVEGHRCMAQARPMVPIRYLSLQ